MREVYTCKAERVANIEGSLNREPLWFPLAALLIALPCIQRIIYVYVQRIYMEKTV